MRHRPHGVPAPAWRLGLAGFLATAVAFGPARNGFGLFLPVFRQEFGLSTAVSGMIAGGAYVGYLLALSIVGLSAARIGSRTFLMIGGLSATVGMVLVAVAGDTITLTAGLVLAASFAGWSWAPYNDTVEHEVPSSFRSRVLSAVSTGTSFGLAAAGFVVLAVTVWGLSWRVAWSGFAAAALVVTLWNAAALPAEDKSPSSADDSEAGGRRWRRPGSTALFAAAFAAGILSGFHYSFSVDVVSRSAALPAEAGPVFFMVMGVAGSVGLLTGDAIADFGLRRVLAACFAFFGVTGLVLGAAPASWITVGIAATTLGAAIMGTSALLSTWSSLLFAEKASTGFSATLVFLGLGSVVGPVGLGAFAGRSSLEAAFLVAGGLGFVASVGAAVTTPPGPSPEPSTGR